MVKIVKFGGSSVANAGQFKKVKAIVESDPTRQFVVVSAAGKQNKEDNKITDLLYLLQAHLKYGIDFTNIYTMIEKRFLHIAKELDLKYNIVTELQEFKKELSKSTDINYLVSRGEYFTGKMMAEYLGYEFVDAKDLIFFNSDGRTFNYDKIREAFDKIVDEHTRLVIPGFYGSMPDGSLQLMSRGGGDVTGSIMANVVDADVYENWTDVSGILMADPRIVKNPKGINVINYSELRELSYMGASVIHEEAIFPVKAKDIPIHIRNTNRPEDAGTIIKDKVKDDGTNMITGIAGKKDFSVISICKNHMSNEVGLIKRCLDIFDKYNVSIEHIPSGIDSFSVIVESAAVKPCLYDMIAEIKKSCKPDEVSVEDEISLIATVSRKMKNVAGMSGRLFTALGKEKISVKVISQTSDEMNIIVGVNNKDYERTIQAIYNEFEG